MCIVLHLRYGAMILDLSCHFTTGTILRNPLIKNSPCFTTEISARKKLNTNLYDQRPTATNEKRSTFVKTNFPYFIQTDFSSELITKTRPSKKNIFTSHISHLLFQNIISTIKFSLESLSDLLFKTRMNARTERFPPSKI